VATARKRLLTIRRLYGWTQRDLAERLEVDPVTVSRWERGISAPRRRIVRQLERLFEAASAKSEPARAARRGAPSPAEAAPLRAPSRFEGIDELVRIVGLDRALDALRELALLGRAPAPVKFADDPTTRLREVETAVREQSELIARARIRRRR
jgi:transcriptional regulator with XRE-family HTH domain